MFWYILRLIDTKRFSPETPIRTWGCAKDALTSVVSRAAKSRSSVNAITSVRKMAFHRRVLRFVANDALKGDDGQFASKFERRHAWHVAVEARPTRREAFHIHKSS
jgi:hypothetical protein